MNTNISDIAFLFNGKKRPISGELYPVFGGNGIVDYSDESNAKDCVIIGRVGAYCGSVYRSEGPCWITDNAIGVQAKDKVNIDFLYYLLCSLHLNRKQIGAAQPLLTQKIISEICVSIPELCVQEKIASILCSLDQKIQVNRRINDNLQQQARTLYKSWFVDFEPFNHVRPNNWKTGKLKDILQLNRRAFKPGSNKSLPYLPIDTIPMNTFAIDEFKANDEAQSSLITFDKDDIIIGAMRVYFHRVVLAPCAGITRTTCFVLTPFDRAYLSFALLCCDQDSSIEYAQSTSKGTTMPYAIWEGGLGDMEICIPTYEIARKFNELILPILKKIQSSYFENNYLREMRDTLLPSLLSSNGRLS